VGLWVGSRVERRGGGSWSWRVEESFSRVEGKGGEKLELESDYFVCDCLTFQSILFATQAMDKFWKLSIVATISASFSSLFASYLLLWLPFGLMPWTNTSILQLQL